MMEAIALSRGTPEVTIMLDIHEAKDRAVRFAVATGEMPDMDLIHDIQIWEGHKPCFGRATRRCPHHRCRWHAQCMALLNFDVNGRIARRNA